MTVKTFDFTPGSGEKWSWDRIEMEHRQSIAVSLDRIAEELSRANRYTERWYDKYSEAEAALLLMSEREEVVFQFGDREYMRLSEFTERVRKVFGWSALSKNPVEAINRTNYLRAERRGRGYRVYLLQGD